MSTGVVSSMSTTPVGTVLMKLTTSVAAENTVSSVPRPSSYEAATRRMAPIRSWVTTKVGSIAPRMSSQVAPPSVDTCHW
ncbi:hypothetical protein D9M68_777360 [compost metagenome]